MEDSDETKFIFTLIKNVEKRKCLYERTDAFYYNKFVREKSWAEVGEACKKSDTECKHRWKLLRERFCKELKRLESPSGSRVGCLQEWAFFQPMLFLKGSLAPRRSNRDNVDNTVSHILEESLSEELLTDSPTATPVPRKKQKTTIDSLCLKFDETIDNIERKLSAPLGETTDEAFAKIIVHLMRDLPIETKDDFQAGVIQELYRVRKTFRHQNV